MAVDNRTDNRGAGSWLDSFGLKDAVQSFGDTIRQTVEVISEQIENARRPLSNGEFEKLTAEVKQSGGRLDDVDTRGILKNDSAAGQARVQEVKTEITQQYRSEFLKSKSTAQLKSGSPAYYDAALSYLIKQTAFSQLPMKDQIAVLQSEPVAIPEKVLTALQARRNDWTMRSSAQRLSQGVLLQAKKAGAAADLAAKAGNTAVTLRSRAFSARLLETASRIDPENRELKLEAALAHHAWGKLEVDPANRSKLFAKIEKDLSIILQNHPDDWRAMRLLGNIYREQEKPEAAQASDRKAADLLGNRIEALSLQLEAELDAQPQQAAQTFIEMNADIESGSHLLCDSVEARFKQLKTLSALNRNIPELEEKLSDLLSKSYLSGFRAQMDGNAERFKALRDELVNTVKAATAKPPTRENIQLARLAYQAENELGDIDGALMALDRWQRLIGIQPPPSVSSGQRIDDLMEVMAGYSQLLNYLDARKDLHQNKLPAELADTPGKMRLIRDSILSILKKDGAFAEPSAERYATQLFEQAIGFHDPAMQKYWSAAGIKEFLKTNTTIDQRLSEIPKIADATERRGACLQALKALVQVRANRRIDETIQRMIATLPKNSGDQGLIEAYAEIYRELKGSGLPQEATIAEGAARLVKSFKLSEQASERLNQLILLRAHYQIHADQKGIINTEKAIAKLGDDLETAAKRSQIPQEKIGLLVQRIKIQGIELENASSASEKISGYGLPNYVKVIYLSKIRDARQEILNATQLPLEFRLEKLKELSLALLRLEPLTKGPAPLLSTKDYQGEVKLQNEVAGKVLLQAAQAIASDTTSDPASRMKIFLALGQAAQTQAALHPQALSNEFQVEFVKIAGSIADKYIEGANPDKTNPAAARLRFAAANRMERLAAASMEKGDWSILGLMHPEQMRGFMQVSFNADLLQAQITQTEGSQKFAMRLQAMTYLSLLGDTGELKDQFAAASKEARAVSDPEEKIGRLFALSEQLNQSGSAKESRALLKEIQSFDDPKYSPKIREAAFLARGIELHQLGDLENAKQIYASLPENGKAAQLHDAIEKLELHQRGNAVAIYLVAVLDASIQSYVQKGGLKAKPFEKLLRESQGKAIEMIRSGNYASLEAVMQESGLNDALQIHGHFVDSAGTPDHHRAVEQFQKNYQLLLDYVRHSDNPKVSPQQLAQSGMKLAVRLMEENQFSAAGAVAQSLLQNPTVAAEAKAFAEALPSKALRHAIWQEAKNFTVIFAENDREAAKSMLSLLAGFGAGKVASLIAASRTIDKAAKVLRLAQAAPGALRIGVFQTSVWAAGAAAESAAFTAVNAAMEAMLGDPSNISALHLLKEFGSMFVTFGLLAKLGNVSMAMQKAMGKSAEAGLGKFAVGATGFTVNTVGFCGADLFNEYVTGLKDKQDIPWQLRLFRSALMNVHMMGAHKIVDKMSGGWITRQEQALQFKKQLASAPKFLVGPSNSPALILRSENDPNWRVKDVSEDGKRITLEKKGDPSITAEATSLEKHAYRKGDGVELLALGGGGSVGPQIERLTASKGMGLAINKVETGSKGTQISVGIPSLPPEISIAGQSWKVKNEFHVTLLGFGQSKIIIEQLKKQTGASNKGVEDILRNANQYAAEGVEFKVSLQNDLHLVEHNGNRSIISKAQVQGGELYLQRFREYLKTHHQLELKLEEPPYHVTLYTGENGQAIGIASAKELAERSRPLTTSEASEVTGQIHKAGGPAIFSPPVETVAIDGIPHRPVSLESRPFKSAPPLAEGKSGLSDWAGQMNLGEVYQFKSKSEAGIEETNYVFRDAAFNIYLIPQWLVTKMADHGSRGSKFVVPVETLVQAMAESVAIAEVPGAGRYELHITSKNGHKIGLDSVATEQDIAHRNVPGKKITIEREFDAIETLVVPDAQIGDGKVHGSDSFHAVFLDGNPQYAPDIANALNRFGVSTESWQGENKGRIRIPVTAFPGKYMPPRHVAEAWQNHRTLMSESEYQAFTTFREQLRAKDLEAPVLQARKILSKDPSSACTELTEFLSNDKAAALPQEFKNQIQEKIEVLRNESNQSTPNPRNLQNAKMELLGYIEAALLLHGDFSAEQIEALRPGLINPSETPKAAKILSNIAKQPPPTTIPPAASPELFSKNLDSSGQAAQQQATRLEDGAKTTIGESRGFRSLKAMALGLLHFITPRVQSSSKESHSPSDAANFESNPIDQAQKAETRPQKHQALVQILSRSDFHEIFQQLEQLPSRFGNHSALEDLVPGLKERRALIQDDRFYGGRSVKDQILYNLKQIGTVVADQAVTDPLIASRATLLRVTALFLEMGKHGGSEPSKDGLRMEVSAGGRKSVRFSRYQELSAQLFEQFAREYNHSLPTDGMRLSEAEIALGRHLISRHLDAVEFINNFKKPGQPFTQSSVDKFIRKLLLENNELLKQGVQTEEVAKLAMIVMETHLRSMANHSEGSLHHQKFSELAQAVIQRLPMIKLQIIKEKNPALINGNDIKALAGDSLGQLGRVPSGRLIQKITDLVYSQQLEGVVTSRKAALELAQKTLVDILNVAPHDAQQLEELIGRVEIPRALLGLKVATEIAMKDAQGKDIARIVHYKSNPTPQFHGDLDVGYLQKAIDSGLYPEVKNAMDQGQIVLETVVDALKNKGFRNLVEIELLLRDKSLNSGPKERLEQIGLASAPTAPLIEVSRDYHGQKIKIVIERGWQGNAEHTGKGGIHFAAQRSQELAKSYQRPGETHDQMLARFVEDLTVQIIGRSSVEIPSERNPNMAILLGESGSGKEFGAVVIDKTDPARWKVVTTMFQPDAAKMRTGHAASFLKLLWRTPGSAWGKNTPNNPAFRNAVSNVNQFLERHAQKSLTLLEVTPEEHIQPLKEQVHQFVKSQGVKESKVNSVTDRIVLLLKSRFNSAEDALAFLTSDIFKSSPEYKTDIAKNAAVPGSPSKLKEEFDIPIEEIREQLQAAGIKGQEMGRHIGAIRKLSGREAIVDYIQSLGKGSKISTQKAANPEKTNAVRATQSSAAVTPIFYVGPAKSPALIVASPKQLPQWQVQSVTPDGKLLILKKNVTSVETIQVASDGNHAFKPGDGVELAAIGGGGSIRDGLPGIAERRAKPLNLRAIDLGRLDQAKGKSDSIGFEDTAPDQGKMPSKTVENAPLEIEKTATQTNLRSQNGTQAEGPASRRGNSAKAPGSFEGHQKLLLANLKSEALPVPQSTDMPAMNPAQTFQSLTKLLESRRYTSPEDGHSQLDNAWLKRATAVSQFKGAEGARARELSEKTLRAIDLLESFERSVKNTGEKAPELTPEIWQAVRENMALVEKWVDISRQLDDFRTQLSNFSWPFENDFFQSQAAANKADVLAAHRLKPEQSQLPVELVGVSKSEFYEAKYLLNALFFETSLGGKPFWNFAVNLKVRDRLGPDGKTDQHTLINYIKRTSSLKIAGENPGSLRLATSNGYEFTVNVEVAKSGLRALPTEGPAWEVAARSRDGAEPNVVLAPPDLQDSGQASDRTWTIAAIEGKHIILERFVTLGKIGEDGKAKNEKQYERKYLEANEPIDHLSAGDSVVIDSSVSKRDAVQAPEVTATRDTARHRLAANPERNPNARAPRRPKSD